MIASFGPDIWIADGPCVEMAGFHYPTRMTVLRLRDGGVMVISPIALDDDLRAAVQALGEVRHVIAPNSLHHLALPEWAKAFPQAKLHAAPGLARKRRDIAFHGELGDAPDPDWASEVDQALLRGNLMTTEVVFWHRKSRTVIFTDLLQQFPAGWFTGWRGVIARLDGMVGPKPAVP